MNADPRWTRLEEELTHLQRHVAEQDKVMLGLADEVARLRHEVAALRLRPAPTHEVEGLPGDERPPHY